MPYPSLILTPCTHNLHFHKAEPTHLNSGSGLGRGGGRECTYGATAIREEKSATQRGSFVSGIFNIGRGASERVLRDTEKEGEREREHKFLCKTARLAT